ncbi:hypothetical protein INR49_023511 [Caranx melampygus]|nr:hypothetical protein INR49_023511 [Caranx melampygus]
MWVFTTSAGCVTSDAMTPATTPQLKFTKPVTHLEACLDDSEWQHADTCHRSRTRSKKNSLTSVGRPVLEEVLLQGVEGAEPRLDQIQRLEEQRRAGAAERTTHKGFESWVSLRTMSEREEGGRRQRAGASADAFGCLSCPPAERQRRSLTISVLRCSSSRSSSSCVIRASSLLFSSFLQLFEGVITALVGSIDLDFKFSQVSVKLGLHGLHVDLQTQFSVFCGLQLVFQLLQLSLHLLQLLLHGTL